MSSNNVRIYTAGTLRYRQQDLYLLFFWLMWNDFSLMLIESLNSLMNILLRDRGATYTDMALLGLLAGAITPWINPIVSTWSDRHRGPYGRRRPFLFAATPVFAFFLAVTPFMPDLYQYLLRYPWMVALSAHFPMKGELLFLGMGSFASKLANAVVLAIFSYLYWDVVPGVVMGRFQSLSKIATTLAGIVWSFCLLGLADHHMKAVFVGTSVFCLTVYLISVWQIREGEYPPPDVHTTGGLLASVRAYFVECFSQSYFLWIFTASLFFQLGNNLAGAPLLVYAHYGLGLDLSTMGWLAGWTTMIVTGSGLLCGFALGTMTDRFKGVRLIGPGYLLFGLIQMAAYWGVHDKWTYFIFGTLSALADFGLAIVIAAFTIEVFPREKLGQFCSAQAIFYQLVVNLCAPLAAVFFDRLHVDPFGYFWKGGFFLLAGLTYLKVYLNWQKRHGTVPVPHAG